MSLLEDDKNSQRWLEEHAHRWAELGVVSEEQAASIVRLETAGVQAPAAGVRRGPELPLYSELGAYLGSILALLGGTVMVTRTWDSWPSPARIAIGLMVAAVGLVGAVVVHPGAGGFGVGVRVVLTYDFLSP